jgi:hypothetical protein
MKTYKALEPLRTATTLLGLASAALEGYPDLQERAYLITRNAAELVKAVEERLPTTTFAEAEEAGRQAYRDATEG